MGDDELPLLHFGEPVLRGFVLECFGGDLACLFYVEVDDFEVLDVGELFLIHDGE